MDAPVNLSAGAALALVLRKHHLLRETSHPGVPVVIDDLVGLHATDPASPYLQLRARVPGFEPPHLDALLDSGRVARVPCMRTTLFIEPADRLPVLFGATGQVTHRGRERFMAANGLSAASYARLATRIEGVLAGRALGAREIQAALGVPGSVSPALILMCDDARLVRWRGPGGWRSPRLAYRRFGEAVSTGELVPMEQRSAVAALVDWYLRRYGPVTEDDVAWWTGLPAGEVREALGAIDQTVAARVEGSPTPYLLHRADVPGVRGGAGNLGEQVALLPVLDPYLQGYHDRARVLDPRLLPFVVDRGGNATSVIVVAGRVAGVWDDVDGSRPEVRLHYFATPSATTRRRVAGLAAEVGAFTGGEEVAVVEVQGMTPLADRGPGAVLSPLRQEPTTPARVS